MLIHNIYLLPLEYSIKFIHEIHFRCPEDSKLPSLMLINTEMFFYLFMRLDRSFIFL